MKTTHLIFLLGACTIALAWGCGHNRTPLDKSTYSHAIKKESSLVAEKKFGSLTFRLRFRPLDELIAREAGIRPLDKPLYRQLYNKHKALQYYTFTISSETEKEILAHNNTEDDSYYQMLDYLSNGIQQDFSLIEGNDTLACVLCHYERNYGLSPNNCINLAFESNRQDSNVYHADKILAYDDKLFDIGLVHFKISKEKLNHLPVLSYEK